MQLSNLKEQNDIFKSLPIDVWERVSKHIEPIAMNLGQVLAEHNSVRDFLYFPGTALIGVIQQLEGNNSAAMTLVGREGCTGISIFLADQNTTTAHIVQVAGTGYRIKSNLVQDSFALAGPLMVSLLKYAQAFVAQTVQAAVCGLHHSVRDQFCSLLLIAKDLLPADSLNLTPQLVAQSLGIRGEEIKSIADDLQKTNLINYCAGPVKFLGLKGLEKQSCQCFKFVKAENERILPKS